MYVAPQLMCGDIFERVYSPKAADNKNRKDR